MFFLVLALCGFAASLFVHVSSALGYLPFGPAPVILLLHVGVFVVFIPACFALKGRPQFDRAALQKMLGSRVAAMLVLGLFFYAIVNFMLFAALGPRGTPAFDGTKYVERHRGGEEREITAAEYRRLRAWQVRGFSGHWLVFYAASAALFIGRLRARPEDDVVESELAIVVPSRKLASHVAAQGLPLGLRGSMLVDGSDAAALASAIAAKLASAGIAVARIEGRPALQFKGSRSGLSSRDVMFAAITRAGEISVSAERARLRVAYQLDTSPLVKMATGGVAAMGVFVLVASRGNALHVIPVVGVGWLWLVGGNFLFARSAIRKLIGTCAKGG